MSQPDGHRGSGYPGRFGPSGRFGKRGQLIDAALSEFSAHSFDAASLNSILDRSGVGKGTFYYHFGSKEALYLAVVDFVSELKLAFLREHAADPEKGEDLLTLLHRQGRLSAEFNMSDPRFEKLGIRMAHEPNSRIREAVRVRTGGHAKEYLAPMVARAMETGELRNDLPQQFVVSLLGFLFANFAGVFQSTKPGNTDAVLQAFDHYVEFIRHGLAGPAE